MSSYKKVSMIAGGAHHDECILDVERLKSLTGSIFSGTGITPMLQLVRQVIRDPKDKTQLALLFANQSEDDILLRQELEQVQKDHPDRFKLWFTVDRPTEGEWLLLSPGFIFKSGKLRHYNCIT